MNNDDTDDVRDRVLEVIPSNQLRLIPLYFIITHIYDAIIEKAGDCEFTYDFGIEQLIKEYEMNPKMATPDNKTHIINEIKRLFPGIKITEIAEKYSIKRNRLVEEYNSYWRASWEEDMDDVAHSECELLETHKSENDDVVLNQAIQLSLNEANAGIMVEKSEEKTQKYWV
jgi:hypothetical protein